MIDIKQRKDKKYRIQIKSEEWEFKDLTDMEAVLKTILDLKDKYGDFQQDYD